MTTKQGPLHKRLYRKRGRAALRPCSQADETCQGRMEWANISGEYRDVDDFMVLCRSHHARMDETPESRANKKKAALTPERLVAIARLKKDHGRWLPMS